MLYKKRRRLNEFNKLSDTTFYLKQINTFKNPHGNKFSYFPFRLCPLKSALNRVHPKTQVVSILNATFTRIEGATSQRDARFISLEGSLDCLRLNRNINKQFVTGEKSNQFIILSEVHALTHEFE